MRSVSFRRAKLPSRICGVWVRREARNAMRAAPSRRLRTRSLLEETEVAKVARKRSQALGIVESRKLVWDGENRSGRQAQKAGSAGLKAEQELRPRRIPAKRADRPVAGMAHKNFGRVCESDEQNKAVGVADGQDERLRMKGHLGHPRLAHAAFARGLAHRTVLVLERTDDGGVGAGGRQPLAVMRPGKGARLGRISGHAHVARILKPPAVQRVLLHRGDEKTPVGREGDVEMRALPLNSLGIAFDLRKPERRAIVVGCREAKALGLESEAASSRRRAPGLDGPSFIARTDLLAGAPRAGLAAERQGVDPPALLVGDVPLG